MSQAPAPIARRSDLDWIRVGAFALLILFHVGLVYAPWDWHVHSRHTVGWMREAVLATGPWRLTLLFLVSGAALRFMSRRLTPRAVARARLARLLPPLLFGVLVLVPPQAWLEAVDKGSWSASLVAWWLHQFSPTGLAAGLPLNHLWFVLYIGVYSLVAVALLARPGALAWLERTLVRSLSGWRVLALPILYLAVIRQLLFPWFGITNHLPVDWYNHAVSLGVFVFGFAVAMQDGVWRDLERLRWVSLALAMVSLALLMILWTHPGGSAFGGMVKNSMFALNQWSAIAAITGFGSRHLRGADGPLLRYLTDAVFPCYLAHQTLLVIAIFLLKPWALPILAEAGILVTVTLGGSLAIYEIVRRIGPVRPLWGLKPMPRVVAAPPPTEAAPAA